MSPQDEKRVDVIVTVEEDALEDIDSVTARLSRAGLEVTSRLEAIGQILGRALPERIEELRRVQGVLDVSRSGEMSIGPPEDEVQ